MCKSMAEGGQRCAAHTRPAALSAMATIGNEGPARLTPLEQKALAEYAATPSGGEDTRQRLTDALAENNFDAVAAYTTALRQGQVMNEAQKDFEAKLKAASKAAQEKRDAGWTLYEDGTGTFAFCPHMEASVDYSEDREVYYAELNFLDEDGNVVKSWGYGESEDAESMRESIATPDEIAQRQAECTECASHKAPEKEATKRSSGCEMCSDQRTYGTLEGVRVCKQCFEIEQAKAERAEKRKNDPAWRREEQNHMGCESCGAPVAAGTRDGKRICRFCLEIDLAKERSQANR